MWHSRCCSYRALPTDQAANWWSGAGEGNMDSFIANGLLQQNGAQYPVRLENISRTGAVVRLKGENGGRLLPGETCILLLDTCQGTGSIVIVTQVVHYSFTLAGLQFKEVNEQFEDELDRIIERVEKEKTGSPFSTSGLNHHLSVISKPPI